ncbi:flagellar basal body P-ring formation chaperone FlgA [Enterobacter asburiae]|uniref:flagellar basal body P-ring formation chaperone FlgA n=1 Tax=Scandinavium sp. UTDF21-P1B TaxID=3446379 RepID=UPI003498226F
MRITFFALTALALAITTPAQASVPSAQSAEQRLLLKLNALFQPSDNQDTIARTVELLATPQQVAALCDAPELSLTGNDSRLTGKRTVAARCGKRKFYLPVRVSAQGTWWVASQSLPGGAIVQHGDIEPHTGSLDGQPAGLVFSPDEIIGQRLTRAITAGKPVLQNQLRQQWRLRAGQTVDLVTSGDGFRIRGQGKALGNATVNDTLKVQTANGQIVSGKVAADGQVMIFFRQ